MTVRLNKHIAETGFCSRREADRLIAARRVTVNGQPAGTGAVVGEGDAVAGDGSQVDLALMDQRRGQLPGAPELASVNVVSPDRRVALAFCSAVRPLFERIQSGADQARSLSELRDTLLPRLISGKLRLPEAEREIEEALA